MGILLKFLIMSGVSSLIVMAGLKSTRKRWQSQAKKLVEPPFETQSAQGEDLATYQNEYQKNKTLDDLSKWG